jgi:hypothetical protein
MRIFELVRHEDVTGLSGTGIIAEGIAFTDGTVVLRWVTEHRSTAIWPSLEDVEAVHGHGGSTEIHWRSNGRPFS